MRPVHLEIEGFTSYREKQVIDFRPLKVFAIAGPTGAGKSSLLDGIAFALYGKVPRMGGQNLKEFISLGADKATVRLDFEVGGRCFRVVRVMRQSGAKPAQIDEITNGAEKRLADGTGEVSKAVQQLLGLNYEAFTQSVLLPQGQFAEFLHSSGSDRREILRELLRLGIYEDMRGKADGESRRLSSDLEATRLLLEGRFDTATPESLRLKEGDLHAAAAQMEQARLDLEALRTEYQRLEASWKLWQERAGHRTSLAALVAQEKAFDNLRKDVARAKAANQVLPWLDRVQERTKATDSATDKHSSAERSLRDQRNVTDAASHELEEADHAVAALAADRDRILELSKLAPLVDELRRATTREKELRQELSGCEVEIQTYEDRITALTAAIRTCTDQIGALSERRDKLGYDATAHELLKRAQPLASILTETRELLMECEAAEKAAQTGVSVAEESLQAAMTTAESARANLEKLTEQAKAAAGVLSAAESQERAAAIRLTLELGCPCPVCEQVVGELPSTDIPSRLAEARSQLDQSEAARKAATDQWNQACSVRTKLESKLDSERSRHAECVQQTAKAARRCEKALEDLRHPLRTLGPNADEDPVRFTDSAFRHFSGLEREYKSIVADEAAAAHALIESKRQMELAQEGLAGKKDFAKRIRNDLTELASHGESLRGRLATVKSTDPVAEIETLKAKIKRVEAQHAQAKDLTEKQQAALQREQQRFDIAEAALEHAKAELEKAKLEAATSLRNSDFANDGEVRSHAMSQDELQAVEARILTFDGDRERLSALISDLNAKLNGVDLTEAVVQETQQALSEAERRATQLTQRAFELKAEVDRLRADTVTAEAMRAQQRERTARHELIGRLARDLRSDAFQKYVLEGAFRRLVVGASQRLKQLNERYELVLSNDKFAVLDHDHGSQTRLAETLSGGETFLVSLSLALELSEQVQQAAGAVRLDSLFIDEGFGTLSPDALDVVAEAIENLGKTNRMVGVITHVPELHQRLPRLAVRPTSSGSVVEFQE